MMTDAYDNQKLEDHIANGRFTLAIAVLRGRVSHDKTDAEAWSLLGQAYTESGHHDAAIAALTEAEHRLETLAPRLRASTYEAHGVALLRLDQHAEARSYLHKALECVEPITDQAIMHGLRGSILRNIAMSLIMNGRTDESRFVLEEAIADSPGDMLTLYALSAQYINAQRYDEASPLLDTLLATPDIPDWIRESAEQGRAIIERQPHGQ